MTAREQIPHRMHDSPQQGSDAMKQNVGTIDRIIRLAVGIVIIGAGFFYKSRWGLAGLIPLLTGAAGFCGLYVPFGINTRKTT